MASNLLMALVAFFLCSALIFAFMLIFAAVFRMLTIFFFEKHEGGILRKSWFFIGRIFFDSMISKIAVRRLLAASFLFSAILIFAVNY